MNTPCGHDPLLFCKSCIFEWAVTRAQGDGRADLTYDELDCLLRANIARTAYMEAEKVLAIFERDFTAEELETMVQTRISRGSLGMALDMAKRAGRALLQDEKDLAVINGLRDHNDTEQLVRVVAAGQVSRGGMNTLVDICMERALPNTAGYLAIKIGRRITPAEVAGLVAKCKELGYPERAHDAYPLAA